MRFTAIMSKEKILIGKTLKEAEEILRNSKYRIISNDGIFNSTKLDNRVDRYNLYLEKDIIIKVTFG